MPLSWPLLIIIVLIATLQSCFWLLFYWLWDYKEHEPRKLLLWLFAWGIYTAAPILLVEFGANAAVESLVRSSAAPLAFGLTVAVGEEYLKYLITLVRVWRVRSFNQVVDGAIYAVTVALGFAFVENILYFIHVAITQGAAGEFFLRIVLIRVLLTTLLHTVTSGFVGLEMGLARFDGGYHKNVWRMFVALLAAITVHAGFNVLVTRELFVPATISLLVLLFLFIIQFFRQANYLTRPPAQPEPAPFI